MEHPVYKYRKAQAEHLSQLPEEEREYKAREFRIGNACYIYHQQAIPIQENRLIMYYKEWLEGLPPNISRQMRTLGFEAVSYTHLDVYKRQPYNFPLSSLHIFFTPLQLIQQTSTTKRLLPYEMKAD